MAGFFKLQKEWLENGLTWAEAGVLSDILSWNGKDGKGCSLQERADRCFLTKEGVRKVILKLNERGYLPSTMLTKNVNYVDTQPSTMLTKSANRVDDFKEKKEKIPPHPPIKKKKNYEEQKSLFPSMNDGGKEKKEEVKVYSLQHRCKSYYEQEFKKFKGFDYYYEGADAGNLSQLLKKLKNAYEKIYGQQPTDDETETFFQSFINSLIIYKPDKFVDDKFTLRVINSQFNVVFPKLLKGEYGNERQQQQQSGPTDDFLRRVAAEVEANGGLAF